jgi:hypothetical protein
LAALQEGREGNDVDPGVAGRVELDRVPGDEHEWRYGLAVSDRGTELGQGMAQVRPGRALWPTGPEHLGQYCPAVRLVTLDRQKSQKRPDLFRFKAGDRLAVQADLNRTQ